MCRFLAWLALVTAVAFAACHGGQGGQEGQGGQGGPGGQGGSGNTLTGADCSEQVAALESIPQLTDRGATLSGLDQDQDGVRDDVHEYLEGTLPESQLLAAMDVARALQQSLQVLPSDEVAIVAAAAELAGAIDALYAVSSLEQDPHPARVFEELRAVTLNTDARLSAYLTYASAFDGQVADLPGPLDTSSCSSRVDVLMSNGPLSTPEDVQIALQELRRVHGDGLPSGEELRYHGLYQSAVDMHEVAARVRTALSQEACGLEQRTELFFELIHGGGPWSDAIATKTQTLGTQQASVIEYLASLISTRMFDLNQSPPTIDDSPPQKELVDAGAATGARLLIIDHSTGFFDGAELARYASASDSVSTLRVSLAPPIAPSDDGAYVLASEDEVVGGDSSLLVSPPANVVIPAWPDRAAGANGLGDVLGHGLIEIYLNPELQTSDRVHEEIAAALDALDALPAFAPIELELGWKGGEGDIMAYFGVVSGAGDVNGDGYSDLLVGAPLENFSACGAVRVFLGGPDGLADEEQFYASTGQHQARVGSFVAAAGDVNGDGYGDIMYGAPGWDNVVLDEGLVTVHHGSSTGTVPNGAWSVLGGSWFRNFGSAVAYAGDLDGDGFDEALFGGIGLRYAAAYRGGPDGIQGEIAWALAEPNKPGYGGAVASGDINGDGYRDLIVGAVEHADPESGEGVLYLYLGEAGGVSLTSSWSAGSDQADARMGEGNSLTTGDVNGDGYDDIMAGSFRFNGEAGRVWLYLGSATGPGATADWVYDGGWQTGMSVASGGDVNGDGFDDLLVGQPTVPIDAPQPNAGRVVLFLGSPKGFGSQPDWSLLYDQAQSGLGYVGGVAFVGDVNGDGIDDIGMGAPTDDGLSPNGEAGAALVYHGSCADTPSR